MRKLQLSGTHTVKPAAAGLLSRALLLAVLAGSTQAVPAAVDPAAGNARYEDALQAFVANDCAAAIIHLKNSLQADPDNLAARTLLGRAYLRAGDAPAAEKELATALERGDEDGAAALLERAASGLAGLRTDFTRAHEPTLLLAVFVAFAQGRVNEARDHLKVYLERIPGHVGARRLLARVELSLDLPVAARETLRPMLAGGQPDAATMALMGQVAQAAGLHAEAVDWFERAAAASTDAPHLRRRMAASRMAVGHTEAAISDLEAALGMGGSAVDTGPTLVRLHLQAGNPARAAEVALALVAERPDDLALLQLAGTALEGSGQLEQAATRYREVLAADPDNLPARLGLASVASRSAGEDEALRLYDEVLAEDAGNVKALAGRARIAAAAGRLDEAVQWLEKARVHGPDTVAEHIYLIDIYPRRGENDRALQVATALERRRPEDPLVLEALARTQRQR